MKSTKFKSSIAVLLVAALVFAAVAIKFDLAAKVRQIGVGNAFNKVYEKFRKDGITSLISSVLEKADDSSLVQDPSLKYSLYDKNAYPPLESADARNALPEYKVVPGIAVDALAPSRDSGRRFDTWQRSNGDELSSKYSSLTQIGKNNVAQLVPAWTYSSGAALGDPTKNGINVQTNPIFANGKLFVSSIDGHLISIDAETGRELWRLKLPEPVAKRGMVWQPNDDFSKSRLFVPAGDGVYAVNAANGVVEKEFGRDGRVGSQLSLIAPVIVRDKLILANVKPALEAYDLRSGKLLWARPLLNKVEAKNAYLSGGVPWGGMSADSTRSAVFVSTGNARPELIGTTRPGDNRHSSSVISINADTGEINWAFQVVAHDLWDLDIPAPPVLTTITRDGKRIDVVATVTKTGNTLLLDRDSGKSIFGYKLRRTPVSLLPGEQTSPYQPVFELPEPFSKQLFEETDVTDLSESARQTVLRKIEGAKHGFFAPPVMGGNVVLFGMHGGAEWPGAAVDQATGVLYVPSNQLPWIIRVNYMDLKATAESGAKVAGNDLYQSRCAKCHKADRSGSYHNERLGDAYFPALTGVTILRDKQTLVAKPAFDRTHDRAKLDFTITPQELETLFGYLSALDKTSDREKTFAVQAMWQLLLDDKGYPGTKPPWGFLTALDLNSGKKVWQVPFGQHDELQRNGAPVQGQRNHGGVAVTAGGLVFATGTLDDKIRAFDSANGKELWSFKLPAAGSTPPSTYMLKGTQYVVVVATGGLFHGYSGRSDKIIAFKLPDALR